MDHYVIDYETLANLTILCAEHHKDNTRKLFVIHKLRDDSEELLKFLQRSADLGEFHISFNGLAFDSQISEWLLKGGLNGLTTGEDKARAVYAKAQAIIDRASSGEYLEYPEWRLSIKQLDVFKLHHWDNPAKMSSLKWIQYSMDWHNIQEMPIHHSTEIHTQQEIDTVISYCYNDTSSTKSIMNRAKEQIDLRRTLTSEYGINLYSASEPKISRELFLFFLSEKLKIPKYELKSMRTKRGIIDIGSLILPYTKFQTKTFQNLLSKFKDLKLDANSTKGGFKYSINYKGVQTDYGLGGIHGARSSGIYEAKEGMIIMSSDVTSYYPNLAIRNQWSPAHIPKKEFGEQYEWFFEQRKLIPKKDPKNYVFKIILNSTFGLSIDKHSPFYDPLFGMQITINGQLSLSMLYEMLAENIPGAIPLMQNTDGLEMMIPSDQKENYLKICKSWEGITQLQLEHDQYKKIVLRDVNNYIAVSTSGKTKSKGVFEFEDLPLHKNKSFLIIPKALHEYFVNDVMPEQYLTTNRNIFDYCAGAKSKGEWKFKETCVIDREVITRTLQKVVRYYISNKGCKMYKYNPTDGREMQIEAGPWLSTEFNKIDNKAWDQYDINEGYYLNKIYSEIASIKSVMSNQTTLF